MTRHRSPLRPGALLSLILAIPLFACDRPDGDVDFGDDELGADRFAVMSEGGEVKLGLTDEVVYLAVSDSLQEAIREEMELETQDKEGIGGFVGGLVTSAVGKALRFRTKYPVESIRDVRWEDGELVVEFEDDDARLENFKIDDRPVTEAFREEDIRAFADEFRKLKREAGEG